MSDTNEHIPSLKPCNHAGQPTLPVISLDGKPIEVMPNALESLASIRAQLELMALRQDRVLSGLSVDGIEVSLLHPPDWASPFHTIAGRTISLHDYSQQLLLRVLQQVDQVCHRTEELVLLVLINEWPAMDWLWRTLQSDIQAPMVKLGLLQEFLNLQPQSADTPANQLGLFWREFRATWHRLDEVYLRQDKLALSDALEQDLLPWLNNLRRCLVQLERNPCRV
jgi:hypothetical protein